MGMHQQGVTPITNLGIANGMEEQGMIDNAMTRREAGQLPQGVLLVSRLEACTDFDASLIAVFFSIVGDLPILVHVGWPSDDNPAFAVASVRFLMGCHCRIRITLSQSALVARKHFLPA